MVFLSISLLCGVWFWVLFKYKQEWEPKCVTNRWGHNQEDSDWADNWCFILVVTYVTLCWLSNWFTNLLHCQIGQYIKTKICVQATKNGSMFLGFKAYGYGLIFYMDYNLLGLQGSFSSRQSLSSYVLFGKKPDLWSSIIEMLSHLKRRNDKLRKMCKLLKKVLQ